MLEYIRLVLKTQGARCAQSLHYEPELNIFTLQPSHSIKFNSTPHSSLILTPTSIITCIPLDSATFSLVKLTRLTNRSDHLVAFWHVLVSFPWMEKKLYDIHRSSEKHSNWQEISEAISSSLKIVPLSFRPFITFAKLAALKPDSKKWFDPCTIALSSLNAAKTHRYVFIAVSLILRGLRLNSQSLNLPSGQSNLMRTFFFLYTITMISFYPLLQSFNIT